MGFAASHAGRPARNGQPAWPAAHPHRLLTLKAHCARGTTGRWHAPAAWCSQSGKVTLTEEWYRCGSGSAWRRAVVVVPRAPLQPLFAGRHHRHHRRGRRRSPPQPRRPPLRAEAASAGAASAGGERARRRAVRMRAASCRATTTATVATTTSWMTRQLGGHFGASPLRRRRRRNPQRRRNHATARRRTVPEAQQWCTCTSSSCPPRPNCLRGPRGCALSQLVSSPNVGELFGSTCDAATLPPSCAYVVRQAS
jgi:hypothetical protein